MKIRNLFYLLLALPLVFAACEPENPETDKPVEKEAVLTLTSDATMEFAAEGGEGEITYTATMKEVTRTSPVSEPEVKAECAAEWVTIGEVNLEKCVFTVAANDAEEARETKITVKYDTKSFEVTVKQAAKVVTPEPEPTTFEYELVAAERMSAEDVGYTLYPYDFPIEFSGAEGEEGVDIALWLVGQEGDMTLQAGEYSLDEENVIIDFCAVFAGDMIMAEDAVVVVEVDGDVYDFDITLYGEDGNVHHATYKGEVENMSIGGGEPEPFVPVKVTAERWATGNFMLQLWVDDMRYHELDMYDNINPNDDYLSEGTYKYSDGSIGTWSVFSNSVNTTCSVADAELGLIHNDNGTVDIVGFIISSEGHFISFDWRGVVEGFNFGGEEPEPEPEPGVDVDFVATFFGGQHYNVGIHNYYFVLSDVEVTEGAPVPGATYYYFDIYSTVADANLTIPNGVYTFDVTNSYAAGTFTEEYGYALSIGEDESVNWLLYDEGSTLTVTDGKIVAELVMQDGSKHRVTYEGDLALSSTGGGSTGVLDSDADVNFDNAYVSVNYYGQWYNSATDNYLIEIFEDGENLNGQYLCLEVLADYATSVDCSGTFTINETYGINTAIPGFVDEGYLAGCWYITNLTEGSVDGLMAQLVEGTVTISIAGDGTHTFVIDCVDSEGNKVAGTVSGSSGAGMFSANNQRGSVSYTPNKQIIKF